MIDPDELQQIREMSERQRVYASLREGGTKQRKELGVVEDLLDAMNTEGQQRYSEPQASSEDPPDCLARNGSGGRVAIEVTELVSQKAIEQNGTIKRDLGRPPRIDEMVTQSWSREFFLESLDRLLLRKDNALFGGGPYKEIVVIVHTDELFLSLEQCKRWLRSHRFPTFTQLTAGYLLSYRPHAYARLFGAE